MAQEICQRLKRANAASAPGIFFATLARAYLVRVRFALKRSRGGCLSRKRLVVLLAAQPVSQPLHPRQSKHDCLLPVEAARRVNPPRRDYHFGRPSCYLLCALPSQFSLTRCFHFRTVLCLRRGRHKHHRLRRLPKRPRRHCQLLACFQSQLYCAHVAVFPLFARPSAPLLCVRGSRKCPG